VLGWEVFSELDLVTGSTEAESAAFVARAAQVMRSADPFSRPITASLSGTRDWPTLSASPALDFLQVHPYGPNLSDLVLASVRDRLQRYRKPVFVGECGLSAGPPAGSLAAAPRAYIGVNHAIWATIVSGAMNGRMLWWEDGYDQYERLDLRTQYKDASSGAARFVEGVDFAGTGPLPCETPPDLTGAALGNDHLILGWFRDTHCRPPDWPTRPIQGATIALPVPGPDTSFVAECFATTSGDRLSTAILSAYDDRVVIPLPTFEGSIALKLRQPDSPAATGHPSG
jgi:hypothetical protein